MKTINVTYDAMVMKNGKKIYGETCIDISVLDDVADNLISNGRSGVAIQEIEKALEPLERLKGRTYIKGSITNIVEVKDSNETEEKCNNGMIETNIGTMPMEDYMDIVASRYGYDSYEEMNAFFNPGREQVFCSASGTAALLPLLFQKGNKQ